MGYWDDFKLFVFGTEDVGEFAKTFAGEIGKTTADIGSDIQTNAERLLTLPGDIRIPFIDRGRESLESIQLSVFGTTSLDDFATNFVDEAKQETARTVQAVTKTAGEGVKSLVSPTLQSVPTTVWIVAGIVAVVAVILYLAPLRART